MVIPLQLPAAHNDVLGEKFVTDCYDTVNTMLNLKRYIVLLLLLLLAASLCCAEGGYGSRTSSGRPQEIAPIATTTTAATINGTPGEALLDPHSTSRMGTPLARDAHGAASLSGGGGVDDDEEEEELVLSKVRALFVRVVAWMGRSELGYMHSRWKCLD